MTSEEDPTIFWKFLVLPDAHRCWHDSGPQPLNIAASTEGLARIWTAIAGFRVQSANRYTTRPIVNVPRIQQNTKYYQIAKISQTNSPVIMLACMHKDAKFSPRMQISDTYLQGYSPTHTIQNQKRNPKPTHITQKNLEVLDHEINESLVKIMR